MNQTPLLPAVRVTGGFWRRKVDLVAHEVLPYQWRALNDQIPDAEPSHAVENFRIAAGEARGEFVGTVFQDSDVAKWLEAASYALADHPDPVLEAQVDEAIRLIGKAQGADGYVNTWFTLVRPDSRWTDLPWGHELYCGGHLLEAAVAHFQSTGKRSLLDIMTRWADALIPIFGTGGSLAGHACGHPEVELALHRLADATGEERYRDLARQFVEVRGHDPGQFVHRKPLGFEIPDNAWFGADYFVAHAPVRHQHHAEGHAVRAMYLYNAMARQAAATGDAALTSALDDLWTSVTQRRMYITGGVGPHAMGERFTIDYDLPPDTAYAETCASIGLFLWGQAMLDLKAHRRYADTMERVLYNGVLSGMSRDGKRFFYVNPLEVVPRVVRARQDLEHVKTERIAWFGCSCCPPNVARLVASIGRYAWSQNGNEVRVDQFIESSLKCSLPGGDAELTQTTEYPWEGRVTVRWNRAPSGRAVLALRQPGWCTEVALTVNGQPQPTALDARGYLRLEREWAAGDAVELLLSMPVTFVVADSRASELAGRVAVTRGPLVFCAEQTDNGPELANLSVDPSRAPAVERPSPDEMVLTGFGARQKASDRGLYAAWTDESEPSTVHLVPYHDWGNRGPSQEMRVWLRVDR